MTDNPGGGAGTADRSAGGADDPVAELARRARDRRLDLLTEHTALDEDLDALDDERFDRIMALTDEVLDLERAAGRAADEAGRRADSREVYVAAAALGTGAGALLLVGSALGWWGGWGVVLLGLDVAVAAGLALGRAAAGRTGRAVAPIGARLALGVGIGAAVLAPDWAPWWLRAGAALAVAAAGTLSLTVLSVPVDPVEEG